MKSLKTFGLILLFLFLALSFDLYAISLSPELIEKLRKEGKLGEVVRQANLAREKGVWQPNPNPPIKFGKDGSLLTDTLKPIVICVDFDDNEHTYDTDQFDTLFFSKAFVFPTGSMRDYYLENSCGKLDLVGGITGWYRMPRSYIAYTCTLGYSYGFGPYPWNAPKLVEDAIDAADPYVDFSDYDHDGDGWVDALFVVHAGPGAEQTGDPCHIWSHTWVTLFPICRDSVCILDYAIGPERGPVV